MEFDSRYRIGCCVIAGMDEVGRGPLAGNVVTACVVMPEDPPILWIDDSKKLSETRREKVFAEIMDHALYVGIGEVTPEEIDRINILEATKKAMREAASRIPAEVFLIDGRYEEVFAEPVDQDADHIISHLKSYLHLFTAEHAEKAAGVAWQVKAAELLQSFTRLARHDDLFHLIHAEVLDLIVAGIVGDKIIILIVPDQPPGTHLIKTTIPAEFHLFADIPPIIAEADAGAPADRLVQLVDVVVDALVHSLDAA